MVLALSSQNLNCSGKRYFKSDGDGSGFNRQCENCYNNAQYFKMLDEITLNQPLGGNVTSEETQMILSANPSVSVMMVARLSPLGL